MTLPNLPEQHKTKEADFGVQLKAYFEKHKPETCGIETKHTRGKDSLPFSEVKPEQIVFANNASGDKGAWIRTLGMNGEQDYVWLKNEISFIVIKYPKFYC